eukprot:186323-Ditylum_brightwellii.AAC.1
MHVLGDIEGEFLLVVFQSIWEVDDQFHGTFVVDNVGVLDFEYIGVSQQAEIDKGSVDFAYKLLMYIVG